jgi:hypothetical protein
MVGFHIVGPNAGVFAGVVFGMIREEVVDTMLNTDVAGTPHTMHTIQAGFRAMISAAGEPSGGRSGSIFPLVPRFAAEASLAIGQVVRVGGRLVP